MTTVVTVSTGVGTQYGRLSAYDRAAAVFITGLASEFYGEAVTGELTTADGATALAPIATGTVSAAGAVTLTFDLDTAAMATLMAGRTEDADTVLTVYATGTESNACVATLKLRQAADHGTTTTATDATPASLLEAQALVDAVITKTGASNGQVALYDATLGYFKPGSVVGTGDVVGPASSTDGGLVAFDGITGKVLKAGPAIGTTAGTVAAGDDARLSDARTPTAHAASHKTGGADALAAADIGAEPAMTAASQAEMEAGTEAGIRSVSPLRVAQAIAALGGGLSGTGAVDNAVLRADGTGGETLQSSDLSIEDAATATQANVALTNQHAGQTNSALVLTPKGTGALIIGPKPDGTATGGNARGASATDLTALHDAAIDVASGWAATRIGIKAVASANGAIALGGLYLRASATANDALAAVAGTASGDYSFALGGIATYNTARAIGGMAESAGQIALGLSARDILTQTSLYFCRAASSSTDATVLPVNGNIADQAPIPASSVIVIEARICGWQTGGKVGYGSVRAIIERTGTTTRLVAGPTVVAAWAGDAELGTPTLAIAVDDTTERWNVVVTPANTTATEWGAVVESLIDYRT